MSQHILQLQFDDDDDDDDADDDNDVVVDDDDDNFDASDDDDNGKEAKTTPGSDLYWPALPGATGGIKASKLYCSATDLNRSVESTAQWIYQISSYSSTV